MRQLIISCLLAFGIVLPGCTPIVSGPVETPTPVTPINLPLPTPTPAPTPTTAPEPLKITMTIAGDCMLASYKDETVTGNFNDYVNTHESSYFLSGVSHLFADDDWTVVNLENVFTDSKVSPVAKDHNPAYWYKSKTANTAILTSSSVEVANLANNHVGDYGNTGRKDTIEAVTNAGLLYSNNDTTAYLEKDGYTIALICHGLWYGGQADAIINRIKEASEKSDFQIVYYHGGKERIHAPEQWKVDASRRLVDAGADLVIGNHPHVLQPMETYNGVNIVYSMGNFCYGGSKSCENRTILYRLYLTVSDSGVLLSTDYEIVPCYVYTEERNNYRPGVIEDPEAAKLVLDFMSWLRESPV